MVHEKLCGRDLGQSLCNCIETFVLEKLLPVLKIPLISRHVLHSPMTTPRRGRDLGLAAAIDKLCGRDIEDQIKPRSKFEDGGLKEKKLLPPDS